MNMQHLILSQRPGSQPDTLVKNPFISYSDPSGLDVMLEALGVKPKAAATKLASLPVVGPIILQRADETSGNGRFYPAATLKAAIADAQEMVTSRRMIGEMDHGNASDENPYPRLAEASHLVVDLTFDEKENAVKGRLMLLPTPRGKIVLALLESGITLGLSARGLGDSVPKIVGGEQVEYVTSYKIITYEFVSWAGFNDLTVSKADMKVMNESLRAAGQRTTRDRIASGRIDKIVGKLRHNDVPLVLESRDQALSYLLL